MEARKAALILMKNSHFDRTPQYVVESCMIFTENFAVGEISVNVINSAEVVPFIY